MKWKIAALIIVLIFAICCAGSTFAENETLDDVETTDDVEIEDTNNYITIISISNGEIKFSDGFIGYCLDSSKDTIKKDDTFTLGESDSSEMENYVKLAIIEAYKQNKENDLAKIIEKIADGNLDTNDDVIKAVVESKDKINNHEVANIDNTTEATFDFELLKSTDDDKSDCIAYKVSLKTVEAEDILGSEDVTADTPLQKETSDDNDKLAQDNNTDNTKNENTKNTAKSEDNSSNVKTEDNNTKEEKPVNETNKTITNKTNTVITIENNTTIIHKNNVKEINETTPEDNNTNDLMKTAGNPIFILIVVIVIAVAAVVIMKRKD